MIPRVGEVEISGGIGCDALGLREDGECGCAVVADPVAASDGVDAVSGGLGG